jgi:glycosyltransferase involved in cell wall biosynthesis
MSSVNQSKLFIYIPSYNRASLAKRQLDNILSQLSGFQDQVRVLVSNNCSMDPGYLTIEKDYNFPQISIRSNPGNIGGNANISLGFIFANPDEYLWILSDDDLITPESLEEIFAAINRNPDIIHIGDYEEIKEKTLTLENIFTLPRGAGFGLISSEIFKIEYIKDFIFNGYDYMDSSFPHLAILMSTLRQKKAAKLVCIRHKLVFTGKVLPTHGTGDYSISRLGFGYLADFLPYSCRKKFIWNWLSSTWREFFQAKSKSPFLYSKVYGYIGSFGLKFLVFLNVCRFYLFIKKVMTNFKATFKKVIKVTNLEN